MAFSCYYRDVDLLNSLHEQQSNVTHVVETEVVYKWYPYRVIFIITMENF